MEDERIIELYFARDSAAIEETEKKYSGLMLSLARRILHSEEDCREIVNDSLFRAWSSIPPARPRCLSAWLSTVTRNLAIDRFRSAQSSGRQASEYALSLDELENCFGDCSVEESLELRELSAAIGRWLQGQPKRSRAAFLGRYYYAESIGELSGRLGMSEGALKTLLHRLRSSLRDKLKMEGLV